MPTAFIGISIHLARKGVQQDFKPFFIFVLQLFPSQPPAPRIYPVPLDKHLPRAQNLAQTYKWPPHTVYSPFKPPVSLTSFSSSDEAANSTDKLRCRRRPPTGSATLSHHLDRWSRTAELSPVFPFPPEILAARDDEWVGEEEEAGTTKSRGSAATAAAAAADCGLYAAAAAPHSTAALAVARKSEGIALA